MLTKRIAISALLAAAVFAVQPAMAQNKAALGKAAADFYKASSALATSIADLTKRTAAASPHDKEMLTLITGQLGYVDATADGVLALGYVASEMAAPGDLASAKKHLAKRCEALKKISDSTGQYMNSLIANLAATAIIAEANKAKDANAQLGQQPLCAGK